jgi:hypothetical protein
MSRCFGGVREGRCALAWVGGCGSQNRGWVGAGGKFGQRCKKIPKIGPNIGPTILKLGPEIRFTFGMQEFTRPHECRIAVLSRDRGERMALRAGSGWRLGERAEGYAGGR